MRTSTAPQTHEPRRSRIPIAVIAGGIAALTLLLGATAVAYVVWSQHDPERDEARALAEALERSNDLIDAIEVERLFAAAELWGFGDVVRSDTTSHDSARRDTDQAIADLRELLESDEGADLGADIASIGDVTSGISEVRAIVDQVEQASPGDTDGAVDVFLRYGRVMVAHLDTSSLLTSAVTGDDVRIGADLVIATSRQAVHVSDLRLLLFRAAVTAGVSNANEVAQLAELWALISEDAELIRSMDRPPYGDVVRAWFPAELHAQLESAVGTVLEGGTPDLPAGFSAGELALDQSYPGLRDALLVALTRELEG